jgi:GxxExxY protein
MFYPILNLKVSAVAEKVYRELGAGLPDKVYKESLIHELEDSGISYEKDPFIPVDYKGRVLESGIYACFIIESQIVLYVKNPAKSREYHTNQLYSYMKLSGKSCGMILDFNSSDFSGVMRVFMVPDKRD